MSKKLIAITTFLISQLVMASESNATTIASCGESNGYSYYPETKLVPRDKAGWQKDGISGGRIVLTRLTNGKLDLIYYDRTESTRSTLGEGGVITLAYATNDEIILNIRYENTIEVYTFWSDKRGRNQFSLLQSKSTPILSKQALLVGDCREINFQRAFS